MSSTWTAYSKKSTQCQASKVEGRMCEKGGGIVAGDVIVRMKVIGPTVDFHPECWLAVSVAVMKENSSYEAVKRGRKKLDISDEDARQRKLLMTRYSAWESRINRYEGRIVSGDKNSVDLEFSVSIMRLKQDQIYLEIGKYGGAPSKWREPAKQNGRQSSLDSRGEDGAKGGQQSGWEAEGTVLEGEGSSLGVRVA